MSEPVSAAIVTEGPLRGFALGDVVIAILGGSIIGGNPASIALSVAGARNLKVQRPEAGWAGCDILSENQPDEPAADLPAIAAALRYFICSSHDVLAIIRPTQLAADYAVGIDAQDAAGRSLARSAVIAETCDIVVTPPVGASIGVLAAQDGEAGMALSLGDFTLHAAGPPTELGLGPARLFLQRRRVPEAAFDGKPHRMVLAQAAGVPRILYFRERWACEPAHVAHDRLALATAPRPLPEPFPPTELLFATAHLMQSQSPAGNHPAWRGTSIGTPDGRLGTGRPMTFVFGLDFEHIIRTPALEQVTAKFGNGLMPYIVLPTPEARRFQMELHRGLRVEQVFRVLSVGQCLDLLEGIRGDAPILMVPSGATLLPAGLAAIIEAQRDPHAFHVASPVWQLDFDAAQAVIRALPESVEASPFRIMAVIGGRALHNIARREVSSSENVRTHVLGLHGVGTGALAMRQLGSGHALPARMPINIVINATQMLPPEAPGLVGAVQRLRAVGCVPLILGNRELAGLMAAQPGLENVAFILAARIARLHPDMMPPLLGGGRPAFLMSAAGAVGLAGMADPGACLRRLAASCDCHSEVRLTLEGADTALELTYHAGAM